MSGPRKDSDALTWIQQSLKAGFYLPYPHAGHFAQRLAQRKVTMPDVHHAVSEATGIEHYGDPPRHGGTCWRVIGPDIDGNELAVGVEAFADTGKRWVSLCTVF